MKWEYAQIYVQASILGQAVTARSIYSGGNRLKLQDDNIGIALNTMGKDGWEVVGIVPTGLLNLAHILYLRRPLPQE
jgi:hypothetical protein